MPAKTSETKASSSTDDLVIEIPAPAAEPAAEPATEPTAEPAPQPTPTSNKVRVPVKEPKFAEQMLAAAEQADVYKGFGPFYAGTGIIGDASLELGIVSGDAKSGTTQRTGIGIYIRSDHMTQRMPEKCLF